jgi:hypothetical protein
LEKKDPLKKVLVEEKRNEIFSKITCMEALACLQFFAFGFNELYQPQAGKLGSVFLLFK